MNEIRLTVEFCPEDRARLDAALEALLRQCDKCVELVAQTPAAPADVAPEREQPDISTAATPAPEAPAESKDEGPVVEKADIQKLVVTLSAADKKDQVREIVKSYATKVSDIPEDKLGEVFAKLSALQEG